MVLLWTVKSAWSNENVQKVQSRESDRWKVEVAANETVVSEVTDRYIAISAQDFGIIVLPS